MGHHDDHKPTHEGEHPSKPSGEGGERSRGSRLRGAPVSGGPSGPLREHGDAATDLESTADLPETYGVDEVEILCKDPWWYFAYWEVTDAGYEAARQQLGAADSEARLVLRVFTSVASGSEVTTGQVGRGRDGRDIRDVPVHAHHGRRYLETPRANALLRVAIGLLSPEGLFAPIAQSSLVRVPPQQPSSETAVAWLHVQPSRSDGREHERIVAATDRVKHHERSLPWRTDGGAPAPGGGESLHLPGPTASGDSSGLLRRRPSSAKASASRPPEGDGGDAQ